MAESKTIAVVTTTYDGSGDHDGLFALFRSLGNMKEFGFEVTYQKAQGSFLTYNFNKAWANALNLDADYFAMLHDDICPEQSWLAKLMTIMQERDADVVSTLMPIKSPEGNTTTAIGHETERFRPAFRITMSEAQQLPWTFNAEDIGYPGRVLLFNTGCWLVNLRKPGVRETDENGRLKAYFDVANEIRWHEDLQQWVAAAFSEDWWFSRRLHEITNGTAKVFVTRTVHTEHIGGQRWHNQEAWGHSRDYLSDDVEKLKMCCIQGHMRCGGSVLQHILHDNPACVGPGESHLAYDSPLALGKLQRVIESWLDEELDPLPAWLVDRVAAGSPFPPPMLRSRCLRHICMLRPPRYTVPSLRDMCEMANAPEEEMLARYERRLDVLPRLVKHIPAEHGLCITYEALQTKTEAVFKAIESLLGLETPLAPTYSTTPISGLWGVGDGGVKICTGVLHTKQDRQPEQSELVDRLQPMYEKALSALSGHFRSII